MAKKNNKNKLNKKLNKKKSCPCKEKFEEEQKPTTTESSFSFTKFDDGLGSIFGSTKLVISDNDYNLKDYRWLILILVLAIVIISIKAFILN